MRLEKIGEIIPQRKQKADTLCVGWISRVNGQALSTIEKLPQDIVGRRF